MIAVMISGGTSARNNPMNELPTVCRVVVSQLASPDVVSPILRAKNPSATPKTRAMRIWVPNDGSHLGRFFSTFVATVKRPFSVLFWTTTLAKVGARTLRNAQVGHGR